uniref:Protoheme IX farnesyltransferase, mitochondrial n=1 Tax=Glossina palpalis gambiensis TaxID=67801 RepID=A0A1B0BD28_9MUSC
MLQVLLRRTSGNLSSLSCTYPKHFKYYTTGVKKLLETSDVESNNKSTTQYGTQLYPNSKTTNEQIAKQLEVTRLVWHPSPSMKKDEVLGHYKKLSKFRLTSLVVITTMAGYAMAPAPFEISTFVMCSLGTGLVSAAANAINQYHEVPFDSQMSRTKNRVLVTGKLTPLHSIGFAVTSAACGIGLLHFGVNDLAALLSAANLFLYTSIYTPMKRMTILNTWVGSVVGAIPPLIGWAGCSGSLDIGAYILCGLLYAWQFPHFNALSWNLRPDYSRAGYRMMAVTNPDLCRRTALRYTFAIGLLSFLAPVFDITNIWFALGSLPLNGYFCYLAYKFYQHSDSGSSRKLFRYSLIHLPLLMAMFLLCKTHWIFMENANKEETSTNYTQSKSDKIANNLNNLTSTLLITSRDDTNKLLPLIPSTKAN